MKKWQSRRIDKFYVILFKIHMLNHVKYVFKGLSQSTFEYQVQDQDVKGK